MSSNNEIPPMALKEWETDAQQGDKASQFLKSEWYAWLDKNVVEEMKRQAMNLLQTARNEEDRIAAQYSIIASNSVKSTIQRIVNKGETARQNILQMSTQEDDN